MPSYLQIITMTALLLVVSACATTPSPQPKLPIEAPEIVWQTHLKQMQALAEWQATLVIYGQDRGQKFKLRLLWVQQGERYQIKIKDFMGRTVAVLEGRPGDVSLKTSKGQHYRGDNADQLIEELLNLPIHISGMRYWLLGVPAPESSYQLLQLSADGLAVEIEQQGWRLNYMAYEQQSGQPLPRQAEFSIGDVSLRAKISQWQLPSVEALK